MKNTTFSDIVKVMGSNFINLTSSILNGFIIPVLLGAVNYGYYKIFVLYASYVGLLQFGFNDGIMLSYGGHHYDELNQHEFRSNSIFYIILQIIISIIIVSSSFFVSNKLFKTLIILLGVNDLFQNLFAYYQNLSQVLMNFNRYSVVNIIQSVLFIFCVVSIWIYCKINNLHNMSFVPYTILVISVYAILFIWYLYYYRHITFGKHVYLIKKFHDFKHYIVSGSFMTLGYELGILMFNLDSQFVVKFFNIRIYSMYAFAYSMFSAGLTILGSASEVLLPHLKRNSISVIVHNYSKSIACILLFVFLVLIGYFPLRLFIYKFLSEYSNSLIYFRVLLPGMAITCCVSIIISNYYYALKKVKFYFTISLVILIVTFLMDLFTYLIYKNPVSLAYSSTFSLFLWYVASNYFIVKRFKLKWLKNVVYIVLMTYSFYLISMINNLYLGILIYGSIYLVLSGLLFPQVFKQLFLYMREYIK